MSLWTYHRPYRDTSLIRNNIEPVCVARVDAAHKYANMDGQGYLTVLSLGFGV